MLDSIYILCICTYKNYSSIAFKADQQIKKQTCSFKSLTLQICHRFRTKYFKVIICIFSHEKTCGKEEIIIDLEEKPAVDRTTSHTARYLSNIAKKRLSLKSIISKVLFPFNSYFRRYWPNRQPVLMNLYT